SRKWTGTGGSTNSRMSAPAENARSPPPVTTMARTPSSVARSVNRRVSSRRMVSFIAFSTSGRLSVTVATPPSMSWRTVSNAVTGTSPDHAARAEVTDGRRVVAELAQHLVGVLAERRRRSRVAGGRLRKGERLAHEPQRPDLGMRVLADHRVMRHRGIAQEL